MIKATSVVPTRIKQTKTQIKGLDFVWRGLFQSATNHERGFAVWRTLPTAIAEEMIAGLEAGVASDGFPEYRIPVEKRQTFKVVREDGEDAEIVPVLDWVCDPNNPEFVQTDANGKPMRGVKLHKSGASDRTFISCDLTGKIDFGEHKVPYDEAE